MSIKVAVIGAGSLGFTRGLVRDILCVPELRDTVFAFTDISRRNLEMVTQLVQRDIAAANLPARIESTTDRRRALADAAYVLNLTRIGGLEAFQTDIDIPLKYGVDQCVGDTLCAGGIMYGQRNIPQILAFCKDIREVARPGAWLLNYANPNAMNTWAALEYGKVKTLGLCHGVEGGHRQIAEVLRLPLNEVDIICAGINHQTWYISVKHKGRELTDKLLKAFEKHPEYSRTEKVRIDMLRRFGYYTTESNGHVSEYIPWYRKRPREIKRWIDMSAWIHGETGGYLRLLSENRNWFRTDFPEMLKQPPWPITPDRRSHEHAGYIIESLETGRLYRGHFNVRNRGVISNLPDDCVVEVPGYVDGNGVSIPHVGDLPLACAATLSASINVQRMAVAAAVHGDVTLLKQAMLHDPLTAAVCDPVEIWRMTDEMLVAQAQWLPQYRREIARARARLKTGPRVKTRAWHGAARRRVRSLAEMRKHAAELREVTLASDKGNVKRRRTGIATG